MPPRLDQYRGILSPQQIADGINAATLNAARLALDAQCLLDNSRFPSAASLAILSIEEAGKVSILRQLACVSSDDAARKLWRSYRTHTAKNAMWLLPEMFLKGARRLCDFAPLYDEKAEHPFVLDQTKQIAFYTDCLGKVHWSNPIETINEQLAKSLVLLANLMVPKKQVSVLEIELWVKYVGPHLHSSLDVAEEALQQWYEAMQSHGLVPSGENAMKNFVQNGIIQKTKDNN